MKKGEGREGGRDGGTEGRREGRREGGKEGRREGTRAKPGNQLLYYICIHLLDPYWTIYASTGCDLYTTQTISLIISKTNRTVKRHIITCKQLCHVYSACSSPDYAMLYYMA